MIKQAPVKGRNAIKVSFVLPQDAIPGKTSVVGYLAEGGRWHDDETAEAFEPNGAGGHNAVIHT